jgi:putative oxidoreductase
MEKYAPYAAPLGRLMLVLVFISSGLQKITGYAGTQGYMEAMGVPGGLLPLVILTEIGFGLAVLFGFWTRTAAFLLAGFCVLSGLLFHFAPADQMQMILLMKNIAIAGGFLMLVAMGPGAYALDNRARAVAA